MGIKLTSCRKETLARCSLNGYHCRRIILFSPLLSIAGHHNRESHHLRVVFFFFVFFSPATLAAAAVVDGMAAAVHTFATDEAGAHVENDAATPHAQEGPLRFLLRLVLLNRGAWRRRGSVHLLGASLILHLNVVLCRHV